MEVTQDIIEKTSKEGIDNIRNKIKELYPHLYDAACSSYVTAISHGKRFGDNGEIIDQFFMHFDNKEDQVMWNLMYSDSSNYNL